MSDGKNGKSLWNPPEGMDDIPPVETTMRDATTLFRQLAASMSDTPPRVAHDPKALDEFAERYRKMVEEGCPFKRGDEVTPRKNGTLKGRGQRHIVLEVREKPKPNFLAGDEVGSVTFGRRCDIRVCCMHDGHVVTYWCESVEYEPWKPKS